MIRRLIMCMVALLLIVSLAVIGCSDDDDGTKMDLEIWSGVAGAGQAYATSFAIADALSKHSDTIRANAIESLGSYDNLYSTYELSTSRKEHIVFQYSLASYELAKEGLYPFEESYDIKLILNTSAIGAFPFSIHSDIVTPSDLGGKDFGTLTAGNQATLVMDAILRGSPNYEDINQLNMSSSVIMDSMLDGQIDATWGAMSYDPNNEKWVSIGWLSAIIASKGSDVHPISFTKEQMETSLANAHIPGNIYTVAADSLYEGSEAFPMYGVGSTIACWPDADEDLIYEFTKFFCENIPLLQEYGGASANLTTDFLLDGITEDSLHPGAVKYYQEVGLI